jgi:hypothetical protein
LTKHNLFAILRKMKRPNTTMKDPYSGRRVEVLRAAAHLYRGAQTDGEFDFDDPASKINPAIRGRGDKENIKRDLHAEEARAQELTISARVLARTAMGLDRFSKAPGLRKVVPAIELLGRVVTEPFEVARISRSGLVGELRTLDLHEQVDSLREDVRV